MCPVSKCVKGQEFRVNTFERQKATLRVRSDSSFSTSRKCAASSYRLSWLLCCDSKESPEDTISQIGQVERLPKVD